MFSRPSYYYYFTCIPILPACMYGPHMLPGSHKGQQSVSYLLRLKIETFSAAM